MNHSCENWLDWANDRVNTLAQNAIAMNDSDFEIPEDTTIKHVREFIAQLATDIDLSKLGTPRIWLSANGDFVFQWKREGAKLEFKFTPSELIARVTVGQDEFSEKHPHSTHEAQNVSRAVDRYQAA
jgi:hypothetical protein